MGSEQPAVGTYWQRSTAKVRQRSPYRRPPKVRKRTQSIYDVEWNNSMLATMTNTKKVVKKKFSQSARTMADQGLQTTSSKLVISFIDAMEKATST